MSTMTPEQRKRYNAKYKSKPGIREKCKAYNRMRYARPEIRQRQHERYMAVARHPDFIRIKKERSRLYMQKRRLTMTPEEKAANALAHKKRRNEQRTDLRERVRLLAHGALTRAKKMGVPFDPNLTKILVSKDLPTKCVCCEIPFNLITMSRLASSPSLDRLVASDGYVPSNIRFICFRCNTLKNNATADELEMIARYIRRELKPETVVGQ